MKGIQAQAFLTFPSHSGTVLIKGRSGGYRHPFQAPDLMSLQLSVKIRLFILFLGKSFSVYLW